MGLGEAISVMGRDVELKLQVLQSDLLPGLKVKHAYGLPGTWEVDGNTYTTRISHLIGGRKKNYVFELSWPSEFVSQSDLEGNIAIVSVKCIIKDPYGDRQNADPIVKSSLLVVSIEKEPVVKESDQDVMFHYFRVKGAEAMKEASELADSREYGAAKEKISAVTEDLKKELDATNDEVKDFILELESGLERVSSSEYERSGRYYMAQSVRGQYGERSYDTGRGVFMNNAHMADL